MQTKVTREQALELLKKSQQRGIPYPARSDRGRRYALVCPGDGIR